MSDELIPVTQEIKKKVYDAGANKLNRAQTALELGISDQEFRRLLSANPDLLDSYERGKLDETKVYMEIMKSIAKNPFHVQRFAAAKYLYEILTGENKQPQTIVAIQNIHNQNQEKFIEILDAETIEKIKND